VHHAPLTAHEFFGDEGAANHTRLCPQHSRLGLHVFVYGWSAFDKKKIGPKKFPARQSLEASLAISRKHGIKKDQVLFLQQNPAVIDAGVFHNDVIAVGNESFLFCHEKSFLRQNAALKNLQKTYEALFKTDLVIAEIKEKDVSIKDAVSSYLFNTQIVTCPDRTMLVMAPTECQNHPKVKKVLDRLVADKKNLVSRVEFLDLRQSMKNGGGPACLRFRVVLSAEEMAAMNPCIILNDHRHQQLCDWVKKHYRDRFSSHDLADPKLLIETRTALDELTRILNLGNLYAFQS
jgi:succinylarginine dihydrolase